MLSVALMGHPSRQAFIDELVPQLPGVEVVLDRKGCRWDTGRRSLLAYDPAATHHLVVQDDAILCRDLIPGAELAAAAAGERPVGLYVGKVRPYRQIVTPAVKRAQQSGSPWLEMAGPWWGVALIIPTAHIDDLVAWGDVHQEIVNYDRRIAAWYDEQGIKCWYTIPSLVDHRPVLENPSLIANRTADRRAHAFLGDRSALDIDWSQPPVTLNSRASRRALKEGHDMAQKRIANRRIIGRHPISGRDVLVAAKGRPIPDWYQEPVSEPIAPKRQAAKPKAKKPAAKKRAPARKKKA